MNQEEIVIRSRGMRGLHNLLEQVLEKSKEGYVLDPKNRITKCALATSLHSFQVCMFKDVGEIKKTSTEEQVDLEELIEQKVNEEEKETNTTEEEQPQAEKSKEVAEPRFAYSNKDAFKVTQTFMNTLEETTKKAPLLELAETMGVVVPEDHKHPTKIKAFLQREAKERYEQSKE